MLSSLKELKMSTSCVVKDKLVIVPSVPLTVYFLLKSIKLEGIVNCAFSRKLSLDNAVKLLRPSIVVIESSCSCNRGSVPFKGVPYNTSNVDVPIAVIAALSLGR